MSAKTDWYRRNPLIHQDRRRDLEGKSAWERSFDCSRVRPLIVCRGPIRKEAMDIFEEMGITGYGILLSEKDAIVYSHALAPELRMMRNPENVHRVPDYTGASKEERGERIRQIIQIAHDNGYDSIFAGYGFMAEDEVFVGAIEAAGLTFIGPCSRTVREAGRKDEAKRVALEAGVSVTPGVDNLTALTLLDLCPDNAAMQAFCKEKGLEVVPDEDLHVFAERTLNACYEKGVDPYPTDKLFAKMEAEVAAMFRRYPNNRVRLKAIGGGGGKGQRILAAPKKNGDKVEDDAVREAASKAPELAREILNEVKAGGVGDNKNILIELNIETTRHNEIQLIGNGEWCVPLGGRDCSLQMHEQKLLEISITQEGLAQAAEEARAAGHERRAAILAEDARVLETMEAESARFGEAVGLDNVSTFECIVDGTDHFFMEMNTRIQVEHRVTELCYALKFTNPKDPDDSFTVDALVEAMVLIAMHKQRLPKPQRVERMHAAVEARLNATNNALQPHAGGLIQHWSAPIEEEIRDDQGICLKNPDTDVFVKYRVAGAYDSNIALLVTHGHNRLDSYNNLHEILLRTKLDGKDLSTNLEFHYGLLCWFLGRTVHAKPTTKFVVPYLTMVGQLAEKARDFDVDHAFQLVRAHHQEHADVVDRKNTLLTRPLRKLLANAHLLSGWLSLNLSKFRIENGRVVWRTNRLNVLDKLYHDLNLDHHADAPAAEVIWSHDHEVLTQGLAFYEELTARTGLNDFAQLDARLRREEPIDDLTPERWAQVRAAHQGFQAGLEVLDALPLLAAETCFFDLNVNDDLTIHIPEVLLDEERQGRMMKVLAPPPATKADEIVALTGGMYYAQEAPDMPPFIQEGRHFEQGDPLYIIEVMKMFNKYYAPFSGTIDKILIEGGEGVIVHKGQTLFRVTPDEQIEEVDPAEERRRARAATEGFLKPVLRG